MTSAEKEFSSSSLQITNSDITWDGSDFVAIWEFSREAWLKTGEKNIWDRGILHFIHVSPLQGEKLSAKKTFWANEFLPLGKVRAFVNELPDSPIVGDTAREAHGFLYLTQNTEECCNMTGDGSGRGLGQQLHTISQECPQGGTRYVEPGNP